MQKRETRSDPRHGSKLGEVVEDNQFAAFAELVDRGMGLARLVAHLADG
ncbi:MAG TPA: hypothetical protein PLF81_00225 [Candidatus Anammoximicrobium sp.]|nr:hypothetical protein [Candidatus Anammoximicrobium sp.]